MRKGKIFVSVRSGTLKKAFCSPLGIKLQPLCFSLQCPATDLQTNWGWSRPCWDWLSSKKGKLYEGVTMELKSGNWKSGLNYCIFKRKVPFNPLTPKIWLIILPSCCFTFPCRLVMRIWVLDQDKNSTRYTWILSLPVCWIMHKYHRKKFHVNHFWELRAEVFFHLGYWGFSRSNEVWVAFTDTRNSQLLSDKQLLLN